VNVEDEALLPVSCDGWGCLEGEKGEGDRFRFDVSGENVGSLLSETVEDVVGISSLSGASGIMGRAKTVIFSSL
jgi:hypothetical protein